MGEGTRAAEARLLDRMARARSKHAALHRFRSVVLPIGMVAGGVFVSLGLYERATTITGIPFAPILCAVVLARVFGGVTAGRVATLIGMPLAGYLAAITLPAKLFFLFPVNAVTFIAVCLDGASLLKPKAPIGQSAAPRADAPPARHTLRQ